MAHYSTVHPPSGLGRQLAAAKGPDPTTQKGTKAAAGAVRTTRSAAEPSRAEPCARAGPFLGVPGAATLASLTPSRWVRPAAAHSDKRQPHRLALVNQGVFSPLEKKLFTQKNNVDLL